MSRLLALVALFALPGCAVPTDPLAMACGYDECPGSTVRILTPEGLPPEPAPGECLRLWAMGGALMTPLETVNACDVGSRGVDCVIVQPAQPLRTWRRDSCEGGADLIAEVVDCSARCL